MKSWVKSKRVIAVVFFLIFHTSVLLASIKPEFQLSTGYRQDDIDWSLIDGDTRTELTWDGLDIYEIGGSARVFIYEGFVVKGSISYGWIYDGKGAEDDFLDQEEVYGFSADSEDGNVLDLSAGIGYQVKLMDGKIAFTPLAGYAYDEQNLEMSDGFVTVNGNDSVDPSPEFPSVGEPDIIENTYDTQWSGPWLGFDLMFEATEKLSLIFGFEYHWVDYTAVGDWILLDFYEHPKSYTHTSDGTGFNIMLGADYALNDRWSVTLDITYLDWSTEGGIDRSYFTDGVEEVSLDEINWTSWGVLLGASVRV